MSRDESEAGPEHRILLLDPDPYLAFLIGLDLPEAQVIEADPDQSIDDSLERGIDLVIADLRSRRAWEATARRRSVPTIAVVDRSFGSRPDVAAADAVLYRPFIPTELHRAVRRALRLPLNDESHGMPALDRARMWLGMFRVAAVILAAILELAVPAEQRAGAIIFAVAFAYAAMRLIPRTNPVGGAWSDTLFSAGLIALSGGLGSSYLALGLVSALGAGLALGPRAGVIAGLLIATASIRELLDVWAAGGGETSQLLAWLMLFPLAAVTGNLAARVWQVDRTGAEYLLSEANRVLSALHRIARAMPGALEVRSVARATVDELRETMGAPSAALVVGESGLHEVIASYGLSRPTELSLQSHGSALVQSSDRRARILKPGQLPEPLASALSDHDCWITARLTRRGTDLGVLLGACSDHSRHDENRLLLQHLAEETAVSLENARLFARVRELSVDEERERIARELHDGVAQLLTHVRMELGLLSRSRADASVKDEATRLVQVVDRALGEVRSTILALRSTVSGEGLARSLRSYLQDLRGLGGPDITFNAVGRTEYPSEVEAEIFRLAQEVVTAALRQINPGPLEVTLESTDFSVDLTVRQHAPSDAEDPNVLLRIRGLEERVAKLGAQFRLDELPRGGFELRLSVPRAVGSPAETARTPA